MSPRAKVALATSVIKVAAVGCGWIAAASAVYCWGVGRMDLYQPPYDQWITAEQWVNYSPHVKLWVEIGAAAPSVLLFVLALNLLFRRPKKLRRPFGERGRGPWSAV